MASKNTSGESYGTGRTRNFATMIYEESAPSDWKERLEQSFVPAFISPYHKDDLLPTGEKKKAHWHVLIMFDSVKTNEQAKEIFDIIGGVGCERVGSLRGYARYLCHLDNPDKAQYSVDEVTCLCGADYISTIGLATDKYKAIGEMIDYCEDNQIYSYSELLKYCRMNRFDWFRVLCDNGTIVMKEYLKSKAWTDTRIRKPKVDPNTGEVFE